MTSADNRRLTGLQSLGNPLIRPAWSVFGHVCLGNIRAFISSRAASLPQRIIPSNRVRSSGVNRTTNLAERPLFFIFYHNLLLPYFLIWAGVILQKIGLHQYPGSHALAQDNSTPTKQPHFTSHSHPLTPPFRGTLRIALHLSKHGSWFSIVE